MIGDPATFVVKIFKTETVQALKELLMEKKPSLAKDVDGDASHLNLWEVRLPNRNQDDDPIEVPTHSKLKNDFVLSTLFQPVPERGFIHVVVQVPAWEAPWQVPWQEALSRYSVTGLKQSGCFLPFRLSLINDPQYLRKIAKGF
jgi:hypothetical protein